MTEPNDTIHDRGGAVEHPSHYTTGSVECIDAIESMLGEHYTAHCRATAVKYIWRGPHKGSELEDYRKARQYLDWLIEAVEQREESQADNLDEALGSLSAGKAYGGHDYAAAESALQEATHPSMLSASDSITTGKWVFGADWGQRPCGDTKPDYPLCQKSANSDDLLSGAESGTVPRRRPIFQLGA